MGNKIKYHLVAEQKLLWLGKKTKIGLKRIGSTFLYCL